MEKLPPPKINFHSGMNSQMEGPVSNQELATWRWGRGGPVWTIQKLAGTVDCVFSSSRSPESHLIPVLAIYTTAFF